MRLHPLRGPFLSFIVVGLALIAGTGRTGWLEAAGVIGGLGHGYLYPALSALVIARTQPRAIGRSSSIYSSLYDLGLMAGPYAMGAIGAYLGYAPIFLVSAGIALCGAAYFAAVESPAVRKLA